MRFGTVEEFVKAHDGTVPIKKVSIRIFSAARLRLLLFARPRCIAIVPLSPL